MSEFITQEIRHWTGVRLDRERTDLEMDELAYALNADLFLERGVIRTRRGSSRLTSSTITDLVIRRIARINSIRYQVAATALYRAGVSIQTGLHSSLVTTIQPYRPLNDTSTWAFIADASGMKKDDGTNLRNWGITGPAAAPTLGTTGTGLTGSYKAVYTYIRKVGSSVIAESNPSAEPGAQSLTNQNLTVAVTASSDAQVTHIRIYRTVASGSAYLYDQEVANTTATITSSQADSALGAEVEDDNDTPPACGFVSPADDGRLWLTQDPSFPHYVYYTKRFRPEAVPADNYLEITTPEDPVQCVIPFGGIRLAFCKARKYRIIGSGTTPFIFQETPSKRGTPSWAAAAAGEDGVYFLARDGVFRTNGFGPDEQVAGSILPLFKGQSVNGYSAINWDQASKFSLAIFERNLYVSWADGSNTNPNIVWVNRIGTEKWEAYEYPTGLSSLHYEEDTGYLAAGGQDGFVYQLETGANDAGASISMTVDSKDYGHVTPETPGGTLARHLFRFIREDLEGGTFTTRFYADGTSKHVASVATTRRPAPIALPADAQGYRWRKRWTYSGIAVARIYGTSVQAMPLEMSDDG